MRALLALAVVPFSLLAFAACSAQVSTATGGSGGSGGAGTGGAGVCPATAPEVGEACAANGLLCVYGSGCCPPELQCNDLVWSQALVDCAEPPVSCPSDLPTAGDPCDDCFEPGPCSYPCPGTSATVSASCAGGAWKVEGACPPPPPVDCNGTPCKAGEICLVSEGGAGIQYSCVADPCAPGPLSCDCAGSLCGGPPYGCSAMGQTLTCSCPMCP